LDNDDVDVEGEIGFEVEVGCGPKRVGGLYKIRDIGFAAVEDLNI